MYLPPINSIAQISNDPTLKSIRPWWMILLGAAILYLVPARAVLEAPMLGASIEWLAALVPSIARWVELSPFPYNTKLFAVFVWLMMPVQVYWLITSVDTKRFYQDSYLARSARQSVFIRLAASILFFLFFGIFILLAFYLAIVDTPPCSVCVNTSRWAQLFIGGMYSLAFSALIAFYLLAMPLLFKSLNSKVNQHG
jgi:hypothetical protein